MGINVEITNVNKEANFVSFMQDGQSQVKEVVLPAQIKWAKIGKAEVGFNPEGKVNFIKSLEPRAAPQDFGGQYRKPVSDVRAISTMEHVKNASLDVIQTTYNEINARENAKCGASTLFHKSGELYDATFYVTTFVKKEVATPAVPQQPAVNTAEMMGNGDGSM